MLLQLRQSDYDALRAHGERAYPLEGCGVLLGMRAEDALVVREVAACRNAEAVSPQTRYIIDPAELVRLQREARERGLEIIGFYHSHPDHPAQWSPTDLAEAHWIGSSYLITEVRRGVAAKTKAFFLSGTREEDKHFVPLDITLV